jgi:nucleosome binding factor SPN SPT16 subunit
MALNVEDPQSGTLLKTNAKRINLIVKLFTELYSLLENTQAACLKIGMEERKKMKRSFFEEWNRLFKPEK